MLYTRSTFSKKPWTRGIITFFVSLILFLSAQLIFSYNIASADAKQDAVRYEILLYLLHGSGEHSGSGCVTGESFADSDSGISLKKTVGANDVRNGTFLNSGVMKMKVPATLFGGNDVTCDGLLMDYINMSYSGSAEEKKLAFLDDYYSTNSTPYTKHANARKNLQEAVQSKLLDYTSKEGLTNWRDRIISQAFNTCYKWKDDPANPLSGATQTEKLTKENWVTENGGNKAVGLMAEMAIEGSYDDGITTCEKVRDFIFDTPSNNYILSYGESGLQDDLDVIEDNQKVQDIIAEFQTDENAFLYCVGSTPATETFSALPKSTQYTLMAQYMVNGDETNGLGSSLNAYATRALADCLHSTTQFGDTITEIIEREPASAERVDGEPAGDQATCESEGGALGWILCKVLEYGDVVMSSLDSAVNNLLEVPDAFITDPDIEKAFSAIRNIAYTILVPMALVMVISTALGFEFISAYTVKRALPRMVIATIFIALSFSIVTFLVTATNNVGLGISGIIDNALGGGDVSLVTVFNPPDAGSTAANAGQIAGAGVGLAALVAGGAFGILAIGSLGVFLSYVLVALVALFMAFFLLSLRQALIVFLMIMAPLAILSWIFPGNDKLWKLWWSTFSKLLLLYPLIMILIATGKGFAQVAPGSELVDTFIRVVAYFGPYFLIPSMFKFAGGAFATISGMANNRSKGLFDRNKKYRGQKMSQNWKDTKAGEKKFRPRTFNEVGRRMGVGASGRFGFGDRGAAALNRQARNAAAERQAKDDDLKQLTLDNDDAGAIMFGSGGTAAGGRVAAEELYQMKLANGTSAAQAREEVEEAYHAAAAVGFTRSRAQAAGALVMQNKARAIAGGERGNEFVENAVHRLHGNNSQAATSMLDSVAYYARESGRSDLGALAGSRTDAQGNRRTEHEILDDAFRRTGAAKVARGYGASVQAHTDSIVERYNTARENNDQQELFETGAQLVALRNSMGQDMTEDNKRILTQAFHLAGMDISRPDSIDQQVGEHLSAVSGGAMDNRQATDAIRDRAGLYDSGVIPQEELIRRQQGLDPGA